MRYDLAVVGAGILGLSCALAAARRNLNVVVIERGTRALGASVRNFGLVTMTGQDPERVLPLARRSRDVWLEVAPQAGFAIAQRGVWIPAQRPEAAAVLEAFMRTAAVEGCELMTPSAALARCPQLQTRNLQAALWSPHELRVESREAIPAFTAWLARQFGVRFLWETAVRKVDTPTIYTSHGPVSASAVVVCPGDDLETIYPERLKAARMSRCTLQMMRLESPGYSLPGALFSDLSLVRYEGFSELPEGTTLRQRLQQEQSEHLQHGIHLLVAQSADGSLVVGDSHHYDPAPVIFAQERVSNLVLDEFEAVTGHRAPPVRERWSGTYTVADRGPAFIESPTPQTRLVLVTSGIGASTGFAIGEQVIAGLFD